MPEIGDKYIDFELPDQDLKKVKLSDYVGKKNIVLAFYFLDFTSVCTNEMCTFDKFFQELEKLDATVFGISVDSPFSHKAFAEKYKIRYPLLSDFNREVINKYNVVHDEMFGFKNVGKRAVFIIDKQGIIRYKWVTDNPRNEPNYEEIKQVLAKLK
ncbi:MAG TPA: peroxiredoxin [Geobacterales bacterium]|nr:peroxiredoxin [Geobacterales bacterium]